MAVAGVRVAIAVLEEKKPYLGHIQLFYHFDTPGFRIGQRIAAVFSVGFFLVSFCANFFTYVLPLHLIFLTTVIYIIHFV